MNTKLLSAPLCLNDDTLIHVNTKDSYYPNIGWYVIDETYDWIASFATLGEAIDCLNNYIKSLG
jgi:hypothetical protein